MTRHIVWAVVGAAAAFLAASCSPCVSSGKPADAIAPLTLSDGGMGEPCETASHCSAGLSCQQIFAEVETYVVDSTFRACTRDCGSSACPTGFACAGGDGGQVCVPTCSIDADCNTGKRQARCSIPDGGAADGGATGRCEPLLCGSNGGGDCTNGYVCQGDSNYGGRGGNCNTGGSNAAFAPPRGGWCGRN